MNWPLFLPVIAGVGGLVAFLAWKWRVSKIPFKPMPSGVGVYFIANGFSPVTPQLVDGALQASMRAMSKVWPAQAVRTVAEKCAVFVRTEEVSWADGTGRMVAGQLIGHTLEVSRNLSALAHELAHLLRRELDGRFDEEHDGWASRGIDAAVKEYQAALSGLLAGVKP